MARGGNPLSQAFLLHLARKYGRKYGVRPAHLAGLLQTETGLGSNVSTSTTGAQGVSQFEPATAAQYGVQFGTDKHSVKTQVEGAARYLKALGYKEGDKAAIVAALGGYYGSASEVLPSGLTYPAQVLRDARPFQYLNQQGKTGDGTTNPQVAATAPGGIPGGGGKQGGGRQVIKTPGALKAVVQGAQADQLAKLLFPDSPRPSFASPLPPPLSPALALPKEAQPLSSSGPPVPPPPAARLIVLQGTGSAPSVTLRGAAAAANPGKAGAQQTGSGGPGGQGYVLPFGGAYTTGRTDMGVDFTGDGKIRTLGKAKIVSLQSAAWPNGGAGPPGQGVVYKLLSGRKKGKYVYVYEGITPNTQLAIGQVVNAGHTIGTFYPGSSIEMGWWDPALGNSAATPNYHEGDVTGAGTHFRGLLGKLGVAGA